MVNVAVLAPAGTVTSEGVVAIDGLLLLTVTRTPPEGAGADSAIVAVTGVPPATVDCDSDSPDNVAGEAGGGVTVNVVVFCTPLYAAVSEVAVVVETGDVAMPNVADVDPAAMVTDAGTDTTVLALDSVTLTGADGGALNVIDPVADAPPTTELGLALIDASAATGAVAGFQPSSTTSKSLALKSANAGFRMSLFHRVSKVPVMYMSEPLSATISPYFCIARKIFRMLGSAVRSTGSWPLTVVFRRSLAPIGSAPAVVPARCDAGYTYPLVRRTVTRNACPMSAIAGFHASS